MGAPNEGSHPHVVLRTRAEPAPVRADQFSAWRGSTFGARIKSCACVTAVPQPPPSCAPAMLIRARYAADFENHGVPTGVDVAGVLAAAEDVAKQMITRLPAVGRAEPGSESTTRSCCTPTVHADRARRPCTPTVHADRARRPCCRQVRRPGASDLPGWERPATSPGRRTRFSTSPSISPGTGRRHRRMIRCPPEGPGASAWKGVRPASSSVQCVPNAELFWHCQDIVDMLALWCVAVHSLSRIFLDLRRGTDAEIPIPDPGPPDDRGACHDQVRLRLHRG